MTTTTPPTETPQPQPELEAPELPTGVLLILDYPDPREIDINGGGPSEPPPPVAPRRHGRGRDDREGRFWHLVGWLFFMLLAFAVGGLIGQIGRRLLGPIGHPEG